MSGAENRVRNSALDFLYYIANAEYVVTDSFHGTAFSINFGRQFMVFPAPKYNSRLNSILQLTGLEHRMGGKNADIRAIQEPIDYLRVGAVIEGQRIHSLAYLKQALEAATNGKC